MALMGEKDENTINKFNVDNHNNNMDNTKI